MPAGPALIEPLNDDRREHPDNPAQKIRHPRNVRILPPLAGFSLTGLPVDQSPFAVPNPLLESIAAILCLLAQWAARVSYSLASTNGAYSLLGDAASGGRGYQRTDLADQQIVSMAA